MNSATLDFVKLGKTTWSNSSKDGYRSSVIPTTVFDEFSARFLINNTTAASFNNRVSITYCLPNDFGPFLLHHMQTTQPKNSNSR